MEVEIQPNQKNEELMETKLKSLNDFRNNVERSYQYNEMRQNMIDLYQGTLEQEWFLSELIQLLDQIVELQSGITFLNDINKKIQYDCVKWQKEIFSRYSPLLKYQIGRELLIQCIKQTSDSLDTARFIEDVFTSFEEMKSDNNYFLFFCEILKIYKGDNSIKEILDSFDWVSDMANYRYLVCFVQYFPLDEIPCLSAYIEQPWNFVDNDDNSKIICLILQYGSEEIQNRIIDVIIPNIDKFMSRDFRVRVLIAMINCASGDQLTSIATGFDIALRSQNNFPYNFLDAVIIITESMDWDRRFLFLASHFLFFKNANSHRITNMLKAMDLNDENHNYY